MLGRRSRLFLKKTLQCPFVHEWKLIKMDLPSSRLNWNEIFICLSCLWVLLDSYSIAIWSYYVIICMYFVWNCENLDCRTWSWIYTRSASSCNNGDVGFGLRFMIWGAKPIPWGFPSPAAAAASSFSMACVTLAVVVPPSLIEHCQLVSHSGKLVVSDRSSSLHSSRTSTR